MLVFSHPFTYKPAKCLNFVLYSQISPRKRSEIVVRISQVPFSLWHIVELGYRPLKILEKQLASFSRGTVTPPTLPAHFLAPVPQLWRAGDWCLPAGHVTSKTVKTPLWWHTNGFERNAFIDLWKDLLHVFEFPRGPFHKVLQTADISHQRTRSLYFTLRQFVVTFCP